jgi:hypothetical protein
LRSDLRKFRRFHLAPGNLPSEEIRPHVRVKQGMAILVDPILDRAPTNELVQENVALLPDDRSPGSRPPDSTINQNFARGASSQLRQLGLRSQSIEGPRSLGIGRRRCTRGRNRNAPLREASASWCPAIA